MMCGQSYIAASPFCPIATVDPDGPINTSPKGDLAGFVQMLDDRHLAIPDRPGNRRVDTFHNLLRDPRIGLIFLIPGTGEPYESAARRVSCTTGHSESPWR